MSWKDNLQDASFRGVPFKVEGHSITGGRRIKETERWQARTITTDMGPELPKFSIGAYVIQNTDNDFDYFNNRDKLLDVLQNNTDNDIYNVGTLIHPYFGKRRVHPIRYTVSETYSDGGIAYFDIEFALEEDELFPGKITDPAAKMDAVIDTANNYSIDNFINTMNTAAGFVEGLGQDAVYAMMKVQQAVNSVNNVLKSSLATAIGVINTAINTIVSVLDSPCDLYETMQSGCESFKYLCGLAGTVIQGGVAGGCSGTVRGNQVTLDGTSIPEALGQSLIVNMITAQNFGEDDLATSSAEQEDNRALVLDIVKFLLLSYACKIFVRINFSSRNQLQDYLNRMLDAFDEFLLRLGEQVDLDVTDIYMATEMLRASLANLMLEKINTLQAEVTYSNGNQAMSTLELAYNLYEDIDRCAEIFNKNKLTVRHPGFIPEQTDILVLEA
jgi:prophage DNA circulation protein